MTQSVVGSLEVCSTAQGEKCASGAEECDMQHGAMCTVHAMQSERHAAWCNV